MMADSTCVGTIHVGKENEEIVSDQPINFKVGDRVFLRKESCYYHQAPDNCPGIITNVDSGTSLPYFIQWENGSSNSYGNNDIQPITGTIKYKGKTINIKCPEPPPAECRDCSTPCIIELTRRKNIAKEQKKKEDIDKEIKEKQEYYKDYAEKQIIKISHSLHIFFIQELKEYQCQDRDYPFMYLLGMNKDGVITKAYILRGHAGCKDMQDISPYEIEMVRKEIFKNKLLIAGIGRVGRFSNYNDYSLEEISNMSSDAILLSINSEVMWAHKWIRDGHYQEKIQLNVSITNLKRGGERDGGSSKSKEGKEANISDVGRISEAVSS